MEMQWVTLSKEVIDFRYQRVMGTAGEAGRSRTARHEKGRIK